MTANGKRFYTVPEAAELLRVSKATLYREIQAGLFPAVKIRGRYVVPAKVIDDMEAVALRDEAARTRVDSRIAAAVESAPPLPPEVERRLRELILATEEQLRRGSR